MECHEIELCRTSYIAVDLVGVGRSLNQILLISSALACFLARTESYIATCRKQLSTHPHAWGPDPEPGPRGAKELGVSCLCLLKGPPTEPENSLQKQCRLQVAANDPINAKLWLSPNLHLSSVSPHSSHMLQPPCRPWFQRPVWVCVESESPQWLS